MIEMLGAERLVYGRLGSELFTLRIAATLAAPEIGSALGKAIREFKKAGKDIQDDVEDAVKKDDERKP